MKKANKKVDAAIIIIGNEILSGRTQDVNVVTISKWLNELGVKLEEVRVIPDIEDSIVKTINDVRQSPINPHTTDITFSDRYSFSIIKSKNILNLNKKLLDKLVKNFFNDTYLMDQNACSSPHIIFWYGDNVDMERSSKKFWNSLKEFTYLFICHYLH